MLSIFKNCRLAAKIRGQNSFKLFKNAQNSKRNSRNPVNNWNTFLSKFFFIYEKPRELGKITFPFFKDGSIYVTQKCWHSIALKFTHWISCTIVQISQCGTHSDASESKDHQKYAPSSVPAPFHKPQTAREHQTCLNTIWAENSANYWMKNVPINCIYISNNQNAGNPSFEFVFFLSKILIPSA